MTALQQVRHDAIRLLLVEDNPADARLVTVLLGDAPGSSFEIASVSSIGGARRLLEDDANEFDVVLSDWNLPDGTGIDFLNDMADQLSAPIILLTESTEKSVDLEALDAGAADFLAKRDLTGEKLDRAIRYSIERRKYSQNMRVNFNRLEKDNQKLTDETALIEAQVANIIKLAEHLAKPPGPNEASSHVLETTESSYRTIAETCTVGVWQLRPDGSTEYANMPMLTLLGFDRPGEIADLRFGEQFATEDRRTAEREMQIWLSGIASSFEARFSNSWSQTDRDLAVSGCPVRNREGSVESVIVTVVDVTERREAEQMIREMAQKDSLTGLLNRATFMDMLQHSAAINQRNGTCVALLYIDLDNFKNINDTLGHHAGDDLLREVAHRIRTCIRESDFAARLGGDEFTIALNNLQSPLGAAAVAQNLLLSIDRARKASGWSEEFGISIGIAMYDADDGTPQQCLKNADLALYRCKAEGGNSFQFFDPAMLRSVEERRKCEADLAAAPGSGGLRLFYQPQVDLLTGAITGLEALLRWERPGVGLVGPNSFMNVAEESGTVISIGRWVARTACEQAVGLATNVPVSINVSAKELHQPRYAESLAQIAERAQLAPESLVVEITESSVIEDLKQSAAVISDIRQAGFKVALDDFGTGYSSLSILRELPVDGLKIDGSFVSSICSSDVDSAIAGAIIDLGKRMGLRIVAECIETEEQALRLRELGCIEAQGFLYAPPLPAGEISEFPVAGSIGGAS